MPERMAAHAAFADPLEVVGVGAGEAAGEFLFVHVKRAVATVAVEEFDRGMGRGVPEFVEGDPEAAGVAEEPDREEECEGGDQYQQLAIGEHFGEEERKVHHDHQHRRDAVVEVDRAEEEAGAALKWSAAMWGRCRTS